MSVRAPIIAQLPTARNVEIIASPERDDELWVIPLMVDLIDLPRLRHLLPTEFASAAVVDFVPDAGPQGGWVLQREALS